MEQKPKTSSIRVANDTRWALKIAGSRLDCTIWEVLARVELGDKAALKAWLIAAREVAG